MSLFDDNSPFQKIFNEMSPELQQEYRNKGHNLYEYINYETGVLYNKNELPKSCLSIESIQRSLQSGLSISDLTREEQDIIHNHNLQH